MRRRLACAAATGLSVLVVVWPAALTWADGNPDLGRPGGSGQVEQSFKRAEYHFVRV